MTTLVLIGLSGKDIPFESRRLTVPDELNALSSDQPYRTRFSRNLGSAYMNEQKGELFDPEIVSAVERMWEKSNLEK